ANRALDGLSLSLREGELLGLLGPNGAGKTTLIRAISGRVKLDGGSVALYGRVVEGGHARADLGVVPQETALYPLLTARENLETFGKLNGLDGKRLRERTAWALEWTGLADRAHSEVRSFSGGMKRRLNLACGVLHEPKLVLLDEPTVGVDPQSREAIYDMLTALRRAGTSLLLTTHYLEEAAARCVEEAEARGGRIVIIDRGRGIAAGSLPELVAHAGLAGRRVRLSLDRPAASAPAGFALAADGNALTATITDVAHELPGLLAR